MSETTKDTLCLNCGQRLDDHRPALFLDGIRRCHPFNHDSYFQPVPATPAPPSKCSACGGFGWITLPSNSWTGVSRCHCNPAGPTVTLPAESVRVVAPVPEDREEATGMDDDAQTRRYLWRMSNEIEGSELTLHWRQDAKVLRLTADRLVALAEENRAMKAGLAWAYGEVGEFVPSPDHRNPRAPFWWRSELRRRIAAHGHPEGANG